jgi:hypothetical protein
MNPDAVLLDLIVELRSREINMRQRIADLEKTVEALTPNANRSPPDLDSKAA